MSNELTVLPNGVSPPALLEKAITSGVSVEVLEKLMGLQERWLAQEAKRAFSLAMANVRNDLPAIIKTQTVDFTTNRGRTHYKYEDLADVTEALTPVMAKHGLSFRWRTQPGDPVTVTCIVCHKDGHSEESALSAPRDESGNKNAIQALGSAITYLQRYTLKAALGVAAAQDDDGTAAGRVGARQTTSGHHPANKTPPASSREAKQATPADVLPKKATETRRKGVLDFLRTKFAEMELAAFAREHGFVADGQSLEEWELEGIPVSNAQLNELTAKISKWLDPEAPPEMNGEELAEAFWDVVIHIPPKGQKRGPYLAGTPDTIRSLYLAGKGGNKEAVNRLFGFSENFTPKPYNGRISEDDLALRNALDQFVQWREERQQTLTSELRQAAQTDPDPNDDVPF